MTKQPPGQTPISPSPNSPYRDGCVAYNLRRASRIVTRRYEDALRSLEMKAFQFTLLAALAEYDTLPQLVISEQFGMDPSTANRNSKAMMSKGWVTYRPDPKDGRKKHIAITPKGRAIFEKAIPLWEKAQAETHDMMKDYGWDKELSWLLSVSGDMQR